ncbi:hypothetical protein B0H14DRAFT_2182674, partial [Mycena olivaceomarginata]
RPISLAQVRRRSLGSFHKDFQAYRHDWMLMFDNARRYNQEGSSIYVDAEEMQKVFDATFNRLAVGSGLPGA